MNFGTITILSNVTDISIDGPYLAGLSGNMVAFLNISQPANPVYLTTYTHSSFLNKIILKYPYLYALSDVGLEIVDFSSFVNPAIVSSNALGFVPTNYCLDATHVYAMEAGYILHVYQIGNQSALLETDCANINYTVYGMIARNGYAYLSCTTSYLKVADATVPGQMSITSLNQTNHPPQKLAVHNNLLAVTANGWLIDYYRLDNPALPEYAASYMAWSNSFIALADNYTITGGGFSIHSINHTDLTELALVWQQPVTGSTKRIAVADSLLICLNTGSGEQLYRLFPDNRQPELLGSIASSSSNDICLRDLSLIHI